MDPETFDRKQLGTPNKSALSSSEDLNLPSNLRITNNTIEIIGVASVNIASIKKHLTNDNFTSFTQVIASMIENTLSISTVIHNHVRSFEQYFKKTGANGITIEALSYYLEMCRSHDVANSGFSNVKSLLNYWHHLGLSGVDDDIIDFLAPIQAPKPKRPAGSQVRSDNPEEGWYTDTEYNTLVARIWSSYEYKETTLWKVTVLLLSAQYGRRPVQIAHLKIGDLKSAGESYGVSGRRIEFPGAKDKGSGGFRQSKIEVHPVSDDLWRLCHLQANDTISRFQACLGRTLNTKEKKLLPLFPPIAQKTLLKKINAATLLATSEKEMLNSSILHTHAQRITVTVRKGPGGDPVISERTNRPLVQYAYRNRYTRAKQLARMGVPRATLQYWMGHESEQSLEAYYDDPAERARVLNKKIAPLMSYLAQAFQGTMRDKEADAVRGDDPTSRIELDGREESGVGTCGEYGYCAASVPIPCYRCTKFQPWVYGPHAEVLERLLDRQKLENEAPRTGQSKRLIAPIQLDNDIEAVRTVIALCENRKKILKETK